MGDGIGHNRSTLTTIFLFLVSDPFIIVFGSVPARSRTTHEPFAVVNLRTKKKHD